MRIRLSARMLAQIEQHDTKYCSGCRTVKPLTEFSSWLGGRKERNHYCYDCANKRGRNPDLRALRCKREAVRRQQLPKTHARNHNLKRFSLNQEQYEMLLKEQAGVCAICQKPETTRHNGGTTSSLAVDHDHATGKIRGLLCSRCNPGLGYFKDDPVLLSNAIRYIERSTITILD